MHRIHRGEHPVAVMTIKRDPLTKAYLYTNAIRTFPVKAGEVWGCADAIFVCGDLEGESRLGEVLQEYPCDMMYVDPPWGAGVASTYRTKAGVQRRQVNANNLYERIVEPARSRRQLAYVETGIRQRKWLVSLLKDLGARVTVWDTTYYGNKPSVLAAADWRPEPTALPDFTGLDDEHTPVVAIKAHQPSRVLDPCGGRGLTARAAWEVGASSLLHELSPYRMAEALKSMRALTGEEPYRLS